MNSATIDLLPNDLRNKEQKKLQTTNGKEFSQTMDLTRSNVVVLFWTHKKDLCH